MTGRWTDAEGHKWPITGHWCAACGLPLIPTDGFSIHPGCEVGSVNTDTPAALTIPTGRNPR